MNYYHTYVCTFKPDQHYRNENLRCQKTDSTLHQLGMARVLVMGDTWRSARPRVTVASRHDVAMAVKSQSHASHTWLV